MIIYLIIFFILFLFTPFDFIKENINFKNRILLIIIVLFIIFDGCRWETGTDWPTYYKFFSELVNNYKFEYGYVILNVFVKYFSNNYSFLLILISSIIYILYFFSINDYSEFPFLTILLFYVSFVGYLGMHRQHIALALCLFSFRYIVRKKFLAFCCIVFIASLFHRTAVIFTIVYFLNFRLSFETILIGIIFAYFLNPIIIYILKSYSYLLSSDISFKLLYYINDASDNSLFGTIIGSLKRALIFLSIFYYRNKLKKIVYGFDIIINTYFLSLLIYILFNNSIQVFVSRGNLYFGTLFEILILPYLFYVVKKNYSYLILYLCFILYSFLLLLKSLSTYYDLFVPYKGIFINSTFQRIMY